MNPNSQTAFNEWWDTRGRAYYQSLPTRSPVDAARLAWQAAQPARPAEGCTVVKLEDHPDKPVSARCILSGCQDFASSEAGAERGWIPVGEKLPPYGRTVLLSVAGCRYPMRGSWLSAGYWQNDEDVDGFDQPDVTHWIEYPPLPAATYSPSRRDYYRDELGRRYTVKQVMKGWRGKP